MLVTNWSRFPESANLWKLKSKDGMLKLTDWNKLFNSWKLNSNVWENRLKTTKESRSPSKVKITDLLNLNSKSSNCKNKTKDWETKTLNSYNKSVNSPWPSNNYKLSSMTTLKNSKSENSRTDSMPRMLNSKELPKNSNVSLNTSMNWTWKSIDSNLKTLVSMSPRELLKTKTENWLLS